MTYRVKDLELWEDNPFQVDHKKVRDIAESMRLLKEQNLPPQLVPGKVWRDPKDKKLKVVFGRHRFLACQAAGIAVFEADELDARLKPHDVIRRYQERFWELEDRANEIRTQAADKVRELRERQKLCRDALRDYPGGPRQWLAKRPK